MSKDQNLRMSERSKGTFVANQTCSYSPSPSVLLFLFGVIHCVTAQKAVLPWRLHICELECCVKIALLFTNLKTVNLGNATQVFWFVLLHQTRLHISQSWRFRHSTFREQPTGRVPMLLNSGICSALHPRPVGQTTAQTPSPLNLAFIHQSQMTHWFNFEIPTTGEVWIPHRRGTWNYLTFKLQRCEGLSTKSTRKEEQNVLLVRIEGAGETARHCVHLSGGRTHR